MDPQHFDAVARELSRARSRRGALGALLGGMVGLLGSTLAAAKHRKRKKKKHHPTPMDPKKVCMPACGECQTCFPPACVDKPNGTDCPIGQCFGGTCVPPTPSRCNIPCGPEQTCFHGRCFSLSAGCEPANSLYCSSPNAEDSCPQAIGGTKPFCVTTPDGPFCAGYVGCNIDGTDVCQTDADCLKFGMGPNARCVPHCTSRVCTTGASACAEFYLDSLICVPYAGPCTEAPDCCDGVPCIDGSCRYP